MELVQSTTNVNNTLSLVVAGKLADPALFFLVMYPVGYGPTWPIFCNNGSTKAPSYCHQLLHQMDKGRALAAHYQEQGQEFFF